MSDPKTCAKHPRYLVRRAPTSDCDKCWRLWLLKQIDHLARRLSAIEAENDTPWL